MPPAAFRQYPWMILFNLVCAAEHQFEGWFRDGASYDAQAAAGAIACPVCADHGVRKAPMAPRLIKSRSDAADPVPTELRQALTALRRHVEENCAYVGDRFPEEARRMHYGETEKRSVYGEASVEEARALLEEGVAVLPLPARQDS